MMHKTHVSCCFSIVDTWGTENNHAMPKTWFYVRFYGFFWGVCRKSCKIDSWKCWLWCLLLLLSSQEPTFQKKGHCILYWFERTCLRPPRLCPFRSCLLFDLSDSRMQSQVMSSFVQIWLCQLLHLGQKWEFYAQVSNSDTCMITVDSQSIGSQMRMNI